jgi:ParB family transcriptional regulator, chromosome partitioning protein
VWGRVEDVTDEEFDRILHVDPAKLIIGANVRVDPRLDNEFLASITDGVEEVVTVYRGYGRTSLSLRASGAPPALSLAGSPTGTVPVRVLSQPADGDHIVAQLLRTSSPHCPSSRRAPSGRRRRAPGNAKPRASLGRRRP